MNFIIEKLLGLIFPDCIRTSELSGIEYHGTSGITEECLQAISRIISFGGKIREARLLTYKYDRVSHHAFLLCLNEYTTIMVRPGFTSGYKGEGPEGLSTALKMLIRHGAEVEEYVIDASIYQRIETGVLLSRDLEKIGHARPVRPLRIYEYIDESRFNGEYRNDRLKEYFPALVNFGLLDDRLIDLALNFDINPGHAIDAAYKRLEQIIRDRIGGSDTARKLLARAFQGKDAALTWGVDSGESEGRANLFIGAYLAYRNPRAHREVETDRSSEIREFMLVNELYLLEASAYERTPLEFRY